MNFLIILSTQNLRSHFVNLKPGFNLCEVIKRDNNDVFSICCFSVNLFFGEIPTEFFIVYITLKHLKHPNFVLLGAQCLMRIGGCLSCDRGHLTIWGGVQAWEQHVRCEKQVLCFVLNSVKPDRTPDPVHWGFPEFAIVEWLMVPDEVTISFIVFQ